MELAKSLGWRLADKSGRSVPHSELGGKVVALYFSAHWCPPCRGFTPMLKQFHETVTGAGCKFEIIFVSSDRSEGEGKEYFQNDHGNWLMLDHGQKGDIGDRYEVRGIPSLVVIDSAGKAVAPDARNQVGEAAGAGAEAMKALVTQWAGLCTDWRETAGTSLGGDYKAGDAEAMRAARLARLGGGPPPPAQVAPATTPAAAPGTDVYVPPPAEQPVDTAAIQQLTAMGFGSDVVEQALKMTSGDLEAATAVLLGGDGEGAAMPTEAEDDAVGAVADPEKIAMITAMGFPADQAKQALEAVGGNVENAMALLLGD